MVGGHGRGQRHGARRTEADGVRPAHGPRAAAVHDRRGPETAGRHHVVPGACGGRGRGTVRPRVRVPAGHRLRHVGVQLAGRPGAARRTPVLPLRPDGHRVQHGRRARRVAGRRVRCGAVPAPGRRPPHAVLPRAGQHAHVRRGHARAAVQRDRGVRPVPARGLPAGRHAGRVHGHGRRDRHAVLRAGQPGRGRLLEPGPVGRPPLDRQLGRGGPRPGRAQLPRRRQGGRQLQPVGAQRPHAPVPVPGARLRRDRRQLPRAQRARRPHDRGHRVRQRGLSSPSRSSSGIYHIFVFYITI